MSMSFDYAKEITVAALGTINVNSYAIDKKCGNYVAEFFETVYTKLKEIEDKEISEQKV